MIGPLLRSLLADSTHGGILKLLSLVARIGFFVLVVPILGEGQLAEYVYVTSTALLIAMLASLGLEEQLPQVVGGDRGTALSLRKYFLAGAAVSALLLLGASQFGQTWILVVLFATVVTSGRILAGIVRGLRAEVYERLANLPWVLFLVMATALELSDARPLILLMAASMLLVQFYCFSVCGLHQARSAMRNRREEWRTMRQSIRSGIPRLASNLLFFGSIRAVVLWPVWLSVDADLDQFALAIAVGEVVSQFGMIPVNRAYTRWCQMSPGALPAWRPPIAQSVLIFVILVLVSLAGLFSVAWLGLLPPQVTDLAGVGYSLIFYALVPAFWYLRYYLWVIGKHTALIVGANAAFFLIAGVIVYLLSPVYWFPSQTAGLLVMLLLLAIRIRTAALAAAKHQDAP